MAQAQSQPETSERAPRRPASVATVLGAIGGLALVGACVSPIYRLASLGPGDRNEAKKIVDDFERELDGVRRGLAEAPPEYAGVVEVLAPAAEHAAAFLEHPSPLNLAYVAVDADAVLSVAVALEPSRRWEIEQAKVALGVLVIFVYVMPALGGYLALRGLLTNFRKHGSVSLALSFLVGLLYFVVGGVLIAGVPPGDLDKLGPAVWLLAGGGGLVVLFGIFGVSRETWWRAYLLEVAGVVGLGYLLMKLDRLL
ncbi:MAG: hypothetical protein R3A79_26060 [Nannocystaceae bacterium]